MTFKDQTPWQTIGPFFHAALPWKGAASIGPHPGDAGARPELIPDGKDDLPRADWSRTDGELILVRGRVLDGHGECVPDALLEAWQANPSGTFEKDFSLFARCATDADGVFQFTSLRPGAVTDSNRAVHAPHLSLSIFARGILSRLITRVYFNDSDKNSNDPTLKQIPPERRSTLIARANGDGYHHDIVLQGAGETVFFEL